MNDFLNPIGEIRTHGLKLPHWQQNEVMQFITFRLGDALPQSKLSVWRSEKEIWLQRNPEPWSATQRLDYKVRFTDRIDAWLDEGFGQCLLRDPNNRKILETILRQDHKRRATHIAWVLMPNHVHLLFNPHEAIGILIKDWKSLSARRICRRYGRGRPFSSFPRS